MHPKVEMPAGLRRARRSAAAARATLAAAGVLIAVAERRTPLPSPPPDPGADRVRDHLRHRGLPVARPRADWIKVEESLAPVSAADRRSGPSGSPRWWVLWLAAVACGVLARGGRVFWVGRPLLLISLALPIVRREQRLTLTYCVRRPGGDRAAAGVRAGHAGAASDAGPRPPRRRPRRPHGALSSGPPSARRWIRFAGRPTPRAPCCCSTWTTSARSTKPPVTPPGTRSCCSVAVLQIREVLGDDMILGRLGGDEFAAIVGDPDPAPLARRLLAQVGGTRDDGHSLQASAWIALSPRDGDDADSLLRAVDVALRVAKRTGRGQVSVYAGDPISGQGPGGALDALEWRLIAGEGLEMAVQPIVSVPKGNVRSMPTRRWPGSGSAAAPTRCTGSRWPTSSRSVTGWSWRACGPGWRCSTSSGSAPG